MTWPQIVILCLMVLGSAHQIIKSAKDHRHTAAMTTWVIFFVLVIQIGYAAVLSAGGFW